MLNQARHIRNKRKEYVVIPSYEIFGIRWEDWMMGLAQFYFVLTLMPTILHQEHKPPLSSCLSTAMGCWVLVLPAANLQLWVTTAGVIAGSLVWTTLTIQRLRMDKVSGGGVNLPLGKWRDILLMR